MTGLKVSFCNPEIQRNHSVCLLAWFKNFAKIMTLSGKLIYPAKNSAHLGLRVNSVLTRNGCR